ncbi:hypothetical protein [Chitinophaga nivalis]|uniref:Uncharacterized protein n=1 Tax=Chitinophaga nivalis TaxID=2991709 RepID=A0ABT3ITH2_9BACT|nr:hypothetical protein [Chitinophaga nivalis]MCW3463035.1 hypothetical protein [Chitinophaga nivalis]MCW3487275.1 hypothetical protein [Chitinophaga nivalis]
MDYDYLIINVSRTLFCFGENTGKTLIKPFRILRHKAWYDYVQQKSSLDEMLSVLAADLQKTEAEVLTVIQRMCDAAVPDPEVWEKINQFKTCGKQVIGIITTGQREHTAIVAKSGLDMTVFSQLFYLSAFTYDIPYPDFLGEIRSKLPIVPGKAVFVDREKEAVCNGCIHGIHTVLLEDHAPVLTEITPGNLIQHGIDNYLDTSFPLHYKHTHIKYEDNDEGPVIREWYAPILLWSLLPDVVPAVVERELQELGISHHRINFFEDQEDILTFNMLPFDIDTSSVFLGTMLDKGVIPVATGEEELDRILRNVNRSGILLLYFDQNRPRIEPVGIINCMYVAYLLNRERHPVVRQNEAFAAKVFAGKGWENGTYFYPSPEFFLLIVFRFVRRFEDRAAATWLHGLREGVQARIGLPGNPLELAIRIIISKWLEIKNTADVNSLLRLRTERAGFQWPDSPLYSLPSMRGYMFNPVFDAALIKAALA